VRGPENGLPDADLTLVDGHHPARAVAAARAARRLLVDAGSWRPVFREIFPYAEVVACSAAFRHPDAAAATDAAASAAFGAAVASAVSGAVASAAFGAVASAAFGGAGAADAATAAAIGAPHVAVTHGPGPVNWFSGRASGRVIVPPVPAVDTAGAGDAFHGALAVALARGEELPDALAAAVRVAGVRVVHPGPRAWLDAL
jgi:sugar/nucleoside kinase (ribokinase family)